MNEKKIGGVDIIALVVLGGAALMLVWKAGVTHGFHWWDLIPVLVFTGLTVYCILLSHYRKVNDGEPTKKQQEILWLYLRVWSVCSMCGIVVYVKHLLR